MEDNKRDTKSIIDLYGRQVEVIIYGCPECYPTEEDKKKICAAMEKGKDRGVLYSNQPHKSTAIYGRWSLIQFVLKPGMVVGFSTSGKYNPGFSTTETYTGVIHSISNGRLAIDVKDVGRAFIRAKHVERIIEGVNHE